ncbi:YggT family protein [Parachitinimonas caeni]|uniref:YggT family protein n=1 Tax=Parachitinimonas caeni TaxID=3031301 RepID=A0ABT7DVY1_9NEIS|nr:YggT family protein [Parachitinimonas caeni]MDK2124220.1 YggT family protein [Parachitinimonas caeni]
MKEGLVGCALHKKYQLENRTLMLVDTLNFLIKNLAEFFAICLLLRFYWQVARAPFGHPVAQFVIKLTDFIVVPVRRVVPSVAGYDSATLLLAYVTALLMEICLILLMPMPVNLLNPIAALGISSLALLELMRLSLYILFAATLVQAVLTWVSPYNPLTPLLSRLTEPFLRPIRKLLPTISGVDLSPVALILAIQLLLQVVLTRIELTLFNQLWFAQ